MSPLAGLALPTTVAVDAVAWAAWSAAVGLLTWALPVRCFEGDGFLTRLRPFEADGRCWERWFGIRTWKDRLPEAGGFYPGGFPKRRLAGRERAALERLRTETRRAELTHWLIPAAWPLFLLWNPAWLAAGMAGYAVVANGPCLVVQRYNRARLNRILARRRG